MMITMMAIFVCVRFSVLMTTNAAFLHSHHTQAFHELVNDQQVLSYGFSRKLLLKKMVEGARVQDMVLYNDQKEALFGETHKRREEVMSTDTSHFTTMDYSHVRRRRPIHNNYSPNSNDSP